MLLRRTPSLENKLLLSRAKGPDSPAVDDSATRILSDYAVNQQRSDTASANKEHSLQMGNKLLTQGAKQFDKQMDFNRDRLDFDRTQGLIGTGIAAANLGVGAYGAYRGGQNADVQSKKISDITAKYRSMNTEESQRFADYLELFKRR